MGDYYAGRGLIYNKRGKYDFAHSDFENAEKYSYTGKEEPINLYLGNLLLSKGKYDESLIKFNLALKGKPNSAESVLHIGEIYLIKRDFDTAFEFFNKAIFLNPSLWKAYLGRGTIYLERGKNYDQFDNDAVKAVEAYKKAVKDFDSVPDLDLKDINPEVYLRRSKAYERLGEKEKAEADRAKYQELSEKP